MLAMSDFRKPDEVAKPCQAIISLRPYSFQELGLHDIIVLGADGSSPLQLHQVTAWSVAFDGENDALQSFVHDLGGRIQVYVHVSILQKEWCSKVDPK